MKLNITKPHIAASAGRLAARAVSGASVYSHNYSTLQQDYQLPFVRFGDYAIDCFIPGISHAGAWEPVDLREEFEAKTTTKSIIEAYKNDLDFKEIVRQTKEPFEISDGLLYRDLSLCILRGEVRNILSHDYHSTSSTGHVAEENTLNRILLKYCWKNMRLTVQENIKSCRTCQKIKSWKHKPCGLLQQKEPPTEKWDIIAVDFVLPYE